MIRLKSFAIDLFARVYPRACKLRDNLGHLPLHFALRTGTAFHCGIDILLELNPESIEARHPSNNLLPFMLFGKGIHESENDCNEDEDVASIGTVFEMLRKCPHLIQSGITNKKIISGGSASANAVATVSSLKRKERFHHSPMMSSYVGSTTSFNTVDRASRSPVIIPPNCDQQHLVNIKRKREELLVHDYYSDDSDNKIRRVSLS